MGSYEEYQHTGSEKEASKAWMLRLFQAVSSAFPFEVCNVLVALQRLRSDFRDMTARYTKQVQGRPTDAMVK